MKLTRLGLGSRALPWEAGIPHHPPAQRLTPLGLLDAARRLRLHLVQFADNLPLSALVPAELEELEKALRMSSVAVEIGTAGLEIRDLHHQLALARRFRSPIVRVSVDRPGDEPSPVEVVDRLRIVAKEYQESEVRLALVNSDRFSARTLAKIVEELGGDLAGVCLDVGQALGAQEDAERVVEVLGPHVLCVTLKDFTIRRPAHGMGYVVEGCPLGRGRLNVHALLDALEAVARRPFSAVLEAWVPAGSSLADAIQRERAWAEDGVAYLRKWIPN